jgi:hypothetical protein
MANSIATCTTNSLAEKARDICDLVLHLCTAMDLATSAWKILW